MSESEINGEQTSIQVQPELDAHLADDAASTTEKIAPPVSNADYARDRIIAKQKKELEALHQTLADKERALSEALNKAATVEEVEKIKAESQIEKTRILTLAQEAVPLELLPFIRGTTADEIKGEISVLRSALGPAAQPPAPPAAQQPSVPTPPRGESRPEPVAGAKRLPTRAEYEAMSPAEQGRVAKELINAGITALPE